MTAIARVFPRQTSQTPRDELAFVGWPQLFMPAIDEVHISVAFTWDIPLAKRLAKAWEAVAPVKMGGPAFGEPSGGFVPGRYLAQGNVITSRGCPNRCWFCSVPKREGGIRELPIVDGWNVQDDNILACSEAHVREVFAMLRRQKDKFKGLHVHFTGGLEARLLQPWHVNLLRDLRPQQMFFAYDTPDDLEPLVRAGQMMLDAGWTRRGHQLRCYVLIGYPKDTIPKAHQRISRTMAAGFMPMAMLWHDAKGRTGGMGWQKFQRSYARPAMMRHEYLESEYREA
jgi:hypothetical protein